MRPRCEAINQDGQPCRQAPLSGSSRCFWHDPEHADEAAEARRLGGLRRRREHTVAGAFDFECLGSVTQLRRVQEIVALDALGLDNSIARVRALTAVVQVGARLLEVGELEQRVEGLEAALKPRLARAACGRR